MLVVIRRFYVEVGASFARVDHLLQALVPTGIDEGRVSRIRGQLDEVVESIRNRPLGGTYPIVRLDALYPKVRRSHRIMGWALVMAIGP